jgi:hypothetical protein
MNIQKTPGNINNKPAAQSTTQAAKSAAGAVPKTPSAVAPKAAVRSVSSLVSAAGLPVDKLSASIISFARFFSLPLKPEMLKHIRQQAFEASPNASKDSVHRESLSLAAAAAEGKGAELNPKGLETYARAVDPDWRRQDDGQGDKSGKRKRENNEKEEAPLQKTAAISAADLEKMALEGAGKDPLLAILNRLPEKDGKRWIVLPFDFSDNGREFKVSLRILLESGKTANRADCMALDIAADKRQLFVLEPANRLSVYLQYEISKKEQAELVRELSALLEIAPERIFIKTKTEAFPFEADFGNDLLRSIDEAV